MWLSQNLVEATWNQPTPRFLIHDRDSDFGIAFRRRVNGLGVRRLVIPRSAPRANAFAERMVCTFRRDCFDHVIVWNERHGGIHHEYGFR
jgi:hypothetical protein